MKIAEQLCCQNENFKDTLLLDVDGLLIIKSKLTQWFVWKQIVPIVTYRQSQSYSYIFTKKTHQWQTNEGEEFPELGFHIEPLYPTRRCQTCGRG